MSGRQNIMDRLGPVKPQVAGLATLGLRPVDPLIVQGIVLDPTRIKQEEIRLPWRATHRREEPADKAKIATVAGPGGGSHPVHLHYGVLPHETE
jgi:hypothetical protein